MASVHEALTAALAHQQAGRLAQAESIYRQVLLRDPQNADALHLLGMVAHQLGRHPSAAELIERAVGRAPGIPFFHNNLGTVYQAQGRHPEAVKCFERALRLDPAYPEARINLGNSLQALKRPAEAVEHYRAALRLRPGSAEGHNNLGNALAALERTEEAIASFHEALRLRPDYPEALVNLSSALKQVEQFEEAAACCRRALEVRPGLAEAHSNLGGILAAEGDYEEAEAHCRQALELNPNLAEAWANLGLIRLDQKRPAGALEASAKAVELKPELVEGQANLADAYARLGRAEEALVLYQKALEMRPRSAELHNKLGYGYERLGRRRKALEYFETALRMKPDLPEAHVNRSLVWLRDGDFERGWPEYEWRWKKKGFEKRPRQRPRWDGSALEGRTIMLHAEQGMGDMVHFVRYVPLVKRRGGTVVLECQPRLLPLVRTVPGLDQIVPQGFPLPEHDVQAPLLSLPYIFGTTLATIPAEVPYLEVERARVERWRERLEPEQRFKVGLAWAGNPNHESDCSRSVRLEQLARLAEAPQVALFSLQRGPGREQLDDPPPGLEMVNLEQPDGDLLDTVAAIMNLDLVISIDSMVAHLAGALGRPVWVLLAYAPDWRWLLDREDSPWYPTMRLFRQTRPGDWDSVVQRVAEALRDVAKV